MAARWIAVCAVLFLTTTLLAQTRPDSRARTGSRPDTGKGTSGRPTEAVKEFAGFSFDPPKEWRPLVLQKTMRVARYALPSPSEKHRSGELIVFHFKNGAGSADDNVARWKDQFDRDEGVSDEDFAQISKQTVDGMKVTILEVRGTFKGMQMSNKKPEPGQMMLAAVIETEAGFYYVRTLGPKATIEHWKNAWYKTMLSIKAKKKSE